MVTTQHDRRLERGRRWWDLASRGSSTMHAQRILDEFAIPHLDLREGHTVLDIGCGYGDTFAALREAVSPRGQVIGIDYSPGMVSRARRLVQENRWEDVEVRRCDFTRTEVEPESVDRAIAFASISAMPDVPAALRNAYAALRPGGRLAVFDMKLRPAGWSTPLIWFFDGVYRLFAGWAGVDVLDTARATFDTVIVPEPPNKPGRPQPEDGWPPLTLFVATKSAAS